MSLTRRFDSDLFASMFASGVQHLASATGAHALSKPMRGLLALFRRLICSLHNYDSMKICSVRLGCYIREGRKLQ